jgi:hypothetical protein
MSTNKSDKPTSDAMKGYNPKDRDFQRTEEEVDDVSKSEKQTLKEQNENKKPTDRKQDE